jgi:hypothetical protein
MPHIPADEDEHMKKHASSDQASFGGRRGRVRAVAAALVMLLCAATPPAQAGTGEVVTGVVQDNLGRLIDGMPVLAVAPDTGAVVASTISNAVGEISFTLTQGTYDFIADPPTGSPYTAARLAAVEVPGLTSIRLVLTSPPITWSGRVVDTSGLPYQDARITVDDYIRATTGTDGRFSFTNQAANPSSVSVSGPDGAFSTYLPAADLSHDWIDSDVVIAPPNGRQLLVHVRDPQGAPIAAWVLVSCGTQATLLGRAVMASSTSRSFGTDPSLPLYDTAPGGSCSVRVSQSNYSASPVTLPDGATEVTLTLQRTGLITWSGKVVDTAGNPVPYGSISIDGLRKTSFNDDGRFSLDVYPNPSAAVSLSTDNGALQLQLANADLSRDRIDSDIVVAAQRSRPLSIHVRDEFGAPLYGDVGTSCPTNATILGQNASGSNGGRASGTDVLLPLFPPPTDNPDQTCRVWAEVAGAVRQVQPLAPDASEVTLTLGSAYKVSWAGRVVDTSGSPLSGATVRLGTSVTDREPSSVTIGADGAFSFGPMEPTSVYVTVDYIDPNTGDGIFVATADRLSSDQLNSDVIVPSWRPDQLRVRFRGDVGESLHGSVSVHCATHSRVLGKNVSSLVGDDDSRFDAATAYGSDVSVPLPELSGDSDYCTVDAFTGGARGSFKVPAEVHEVVAVKVGAFLYFLSGGANATNDGDNVADLVELEAPNGGDGNSDGTPDWQQANVTSLPTFGAAASEDAAPYITIAAPTGTTLSNVSTIDPSDTSKVEMPVPWQGVTLPEGLVRFVVAGVPEGSDQTISIFAASTEGLTGYAKYDPRAKQWTELPADRFRVVDDHRVDITLTDGGVGDADGRPNGSIDDPGGLMQRLLDSVPPQVQGTAVGTPNAAGWYRGDVQVQWTAMDPERSSGLLEYLQTTTLTGEGSDLAARLEVCDVAGNCGAGLVSGIKIDRTAPAISVAGVEEGRSYTLGAVPAPSCRATDSLSGVVAPCRGELTGGNANGVGEMIYTARALDNAGNLATTSVKFRVVYRVDGFAQPINDPLVVPGSPMSVFKAGSTVPVKFRVMMANGTVIAPVAAPSWVVPLKGQISTAGLNEQVWADAPSDGSAFSLAGDQWQYNWKTKALQPGFTYRIGATLDDGTTRYVVVALK